MIPKLKDGAGVMTLQTLAVMGLFFLTGGLGVLYEVLWGRYLENYIGLSAYAYAAVLAAFIGGLALGGRVLGPWADRLHPLRLYALLEAWVGLYALAYPRLTAWVLSGMLDLLPRPGPVPLPPGSYYAAKVAVPWLLLLPATVAMGGTYPAIVRALTGDLHRLGRVAAFVYAVHTGGAALGALGAVFLWLPRWGLGGGNVRAAFLSLGVSAGALVLSLVTRSLPHRTAAPEPPEVPYPRTLHPWVLAVLFGSGVVSFVLENAWIRYLTVLLGSTLNGFALMLSSVIAAIALGSLLLGALEPWLARHRWHDRMLLVTLWGASLACLGTLPLYERMPLWLRRFGQAFRPDPVAYPIYETGRFAICMAAVLGPALWFGMTLPLGVRLTAHALQRLGRDTGGVYAACSAGNVVGAILGGFVLLPGLGLPGTLVGAGWASAGLACLWGLRLGLGRSMAWGPVLTAVLFWRFVGTDFDLRALTVEAPRLHFHRGDIRAGLRQLRVVAYREDPGGQVLVVDHETTGNRIVYLNGKAEIALRPAYDPTSVHLAMMLYPHTPRRVLILGNGVGISAATALRYPVGHVIGVEILPTLQTLRPLFSPLTDPLRSRPHYTFVFEDAKSYLLWVEPASVDIVIGQAANPWISSIGNLYTLETFERIARVLRPDGLYAQIFYVGETTDTAFLVLLRTLRRAFPSVALFRLNPNVVVFLAGHRPLQPDWRAAEYRADRPEVREDLERSGFSGLLALLLLQSHSPEAVDEILRTSPPGPVNRDENLWMELWAPRLYFTGEGFRVLDQTDARIHGPLETLLVADYVRYRLPPAEAWPAAVRSLRTLGGEAFPIDWRWVRDYLVHQAVADPP